jgi:hypothetical protein
VLFFVLAFFFDGLLVDSILFQLTFVLLDLLFYIFLSIVLRLLLLLIHFVLYIQFILGYFLLNINFPFLFSLVINFILHKHVFIHQSSFFLLFPMLLSIFFQLFLLLLELLFLDILILLLKLIPLTFFSFFDDFWVYIFDSLQDRFLLLFFSFS